MTVIFQVEHFRNVQPELPPLLIEHWKEIALDHAAVPLNPDWKRYFDLADGGHLHFVTARKDGELVGYHVAIVSGHLHYKDTLHGVTDIYYLKPEYRKGFTGVRLFRKVEETLRELGVKKLITGTKVHLNIGPVLERLGYTSTERTYTKILEG